MERDPAVEADRDVYKRTFHIERKNQKDTDEKPHRIVLVRARAHHHYMDIIIIIWTT